MKKYNVAIVGATGAVGQAMLTILAQRQFPINNLYLLASERSAGQKLVFSDRTYTVENLAEFDFSKAEIGLFSPGASVSAIYAPKAAAAGCIVIDNTSHFRYDDDVPLIVAEVNPEALAGYTQRNIIANPNCSTMQMMVALKPIYDAVGIERINVATYQSVSGTGMEAIAELHEQTEQLISDPAATVTPRIYPHQIAFNVIPHIDEWQQNGYTKEEMKMVWETQKIFNDKTIKVNPTTVRVPVFVGHSEAVNIETREKITKQQAIQLLQKMPGVVVSAEDADYPTPVMAAGTDPVYVGRIREDISHPRGLNLWIVSDNVRKGAALNAIQIAELLIQKFI